MHLNTKHHTHRAALRLGFVGLTDCAPIVMAHELGMFEQRGLRVELSREVGWATIRDKIIYGELEAVHAPAGMVYATTLGLGSAPVDCLTALVLNLHGNAITLSKHLRQAGVEDGHSLREYIRAKRKKLTFGVVYHWSSHHVLLRQWLRSVGIDPERDIQIVVVPPSQVFANLRAGHLDGYCVGEPWASLAVMHHAGWIVARSAEIAPLHPEKVLMVRREFAIRSNDDHLAMVSALIDACAWCDEPGNREEIVKTLALPRYVGAPAEAIRMSMRDTYDFGHGRVEQCPGFNLFARENANEPTEARARWVLESFFKSGLLPAPASFPEMLTQQCFRADLHSKARQFAHSESIAV